MYYDYTNLTSINETFSFVDVVSNGLFGLGIVIAIFVIFMTLFKNHEIEKGFLASSFITLMSGFFLFLMDLVSSYVVSALTLIFLISIFFMWKYQD